ncbi:alpha/beta hydrolase [Candidatus Colwellia aromaticivorans]|uniref:alpha/beta hydrolase n=1 Tax=Candidatus Colwellia aromaticivorans TaxID=2267621 RepID=UPI000DF3343B|nr:alpha/beta hydrolase [Candidatus Colwellia aromaticivorans]
MVIVSIVIFVICIHFWRKHLLLKETSVQNHEDFNGDLYQVGHSIVAHVKNTGPSDKTIICMHGWLFDYRYFTQLYTANDGELILINSCDYHAANKNISPIKATWQIENSYDRDTIEHDAAVLIQAVKNLASTDELLLHGHSRGGAVVLEAIKQNQALFKNATVILEAPVLPEAPLIKANKRFKAFNEVISYIIMYPFPFIVAWLSRFGIPDFAFKNVRPMNARKKHLMLGMFNNHKNIKVLLNNFENINTWTLVNRVDLFDGINKGYILIGSQDAVLSRDLMLKVANRSENNITVIESNNSSHFLTLDIPEQVKSLKFE